MKKLVLLMVAMIMGFGISYAQSGVDWSTIDFVAGSSQYKVQKVDQINMIVNIQKPGWAAEDGIYLTTFSGISNCNVGSAIDGAGIVLYLSSFAAKETEVSITNAGGTFTFWVYNANGTDGPVWKASDVNIAVNRPVYVRAFNGGVGPSLITDDKTNTGNCQLMVDQTLQEESEWMVIDLGLNYDLNKIQIITTGNRKDKKFAIYTAPTQAEEPDFSNGNMGIAAENWTKVLEADDEYEKNGVVEHVYDLSAENARYVMYKAVERNHSDEWGVAFVEVRVAGETNDPVVLIPVEFVVNGTHDYVIGKNNKIDFVLNNLLGQPVEFDSNKLGVSLSNEDIATIAVSGNEVTVTPLVAGETTVEFVYDNDVTAEFGIKVYPVAVSTWEDTNVAKYCPAYLSAIHGGEASYITDDAIGNACQLAVNSAQPVEWAVVDLGFAYNINKIQLVTTGDRKNKIFAIYTASVQDEEPAFANGNMAIPEDKWTLAFKTSDDYANNGVVYNNFAVDIKDVRYVKYVGVERNKTDQYGVGIVELRVAGATEDTSVNDPAQILISDVVDYFVGKEDIFNFTIANSVGTPVEFDSSLLSVSSSDENVATVAISGTKVIVTPKAAGTATITLTYDNLEPASVEITVKPPFVSAPVPTHDADSVLALFSDAYNTSSRGYDWYNWGGGNGNCETHNEDELFHITNWKYFGSQFNDIDVSEYDYMHIDLMPTTALTVGIVPITHNPNGGNSPERGFTTDELTPDQWTPLDIPMSTFEKNGVTNLDRLYQIKYIKSVSPAGAELNHDGSKEIYIDNIYFWKSPEMVIPQFTVNVGENSFTKIDDKTVEMTYTIEHSNYESVKHYHIWVVAVNKGNNMQRRVESVNLGETHHDNMEELTGKVTLNNLNESAITVVKVHAQAVLNDGTTVNPSNWNEGDPEGATSANSFEVNTDTGVTTGVETVNVNADAAPVYYNLQGIKVDNPKAGVYVVVKGDKVSKVIIK